VRRLAALLAAQKDDLSFFALLQVPLLAFNVVAAKALATSHAYPDAPAGAFLRLFARVLPWDIGLLALATLVILASRRARPPVRLRPVFLVLLYLLFIGLTVFHFVNAGFFMFFGAPLTRDLMLLALPLMAYVTKVVRPDDPMLRLTLVAVLAPLVLTPILWRLRPGVVAADGGWRRRTWIMVTVLAVSAVGIAFTPVARYREVSLRRLSMLAFLMPARGSMHRTDNEVTAEHRRALEAHLGPARDDGTAAFTPLRRRKQNVVIWVWESVGERFLRAHHPFGEAAAPNLERLKQKGAVRFSKTYVEVPLSAQSDWSFMTATSPPANPRVFKTDLPLPAHGPYLPAVFKSAGYRTMFLSSSYLESWGETRFLQEAGLDVLEDGKSLPNRGRYKYQTWSIEGRAIVDRFFEWQDAGGANPDPFFALLWNVETHHNYTWIGMPKELEAAPELQRYYAAITYTDKLLGEFYAGLEARGLADDTLIVVIGDHGQGFGRGEHPHDRFHSLLINEDVLHVPLVFLHPELAANAPNVEIQGTLTDIYPTVLDLVGIRVPTGIDGASMARGYKPRVITHRTITWWPIAARAGRFKLVQDRRDDAPELYDTAADPWETRDISMAHKAETEALWAWLRWTTAQRSREDSSFKLFSEKDWILF
jgi:arylsulfatase A-like enzyme